MKSKITEQRIVYPITEVNSIVKHTNIDYNKTVDTSLEMDIYLPSDYSSNEPLSSVLLIHGGPIKEHMSKTGELLFLGGNYLLQMAMQG